LIVPELSIESTLVADSIVMPAVPPPLIDPVLLIEPMLPAATWRPELPPVSEPALSIRWTAPVLPQCR